VVVVKGDTKEQLTLSRIAMEKISHIMKFTRWQVPISLIYDGTAHRSERMTLGRAMTDLRSNFGEHGQLYVAFSRVTDPVNLCFLLSGSSDFKQDIDPTEIPIRVRAEVNIAHIISRLYSGVGDDHVVSSEDPPPSIGE
jgi:hypothetical protein